ncbi:MAG: ribonuclease PH, partial [Nitrospiraceae bacterium]|nr:ribonuclease PH [Nitrospiraceae bacterium]
MRADQRSDDALRPISITRNFTKHAEGSVLVAFGDTKVICTASISNTIPRWLKASGRGWVTAEYAMLPRSAQERINRDSVNKGRAQEISRLIGRSLRCVVDLDAMPERRIIVDCDVIQADGGTRTAAITGAYVALCDACRVLTAEESLPVSPIVGQCAAVS